MSKWARAVLLTGMGTLLVGCAAKERRDRPVTAAPTARPNIIPGVWESQRGAVGVRLVLWRDGSGVIREGSTCRGFTWAASQDQLTFEPLTESTLGLSGKYEWRGLDLVIHHERGKTVTSVVYERLADAPIVPGVSRISRMGRMMEPPTVRARRSPPEMRFRSGKE